MGQYENSVVIVCDRLIRCADCNKRGIKFDLEIGCYFICTENDLSIIEIEDCPLNRRGDK